MKPHRRLALVLLIALTLSCIVSPVVWFFIQSLRHLSTALSETLDYPFYRVMSRVVLVVTLLALYRHRKRLEIVSLASMGLQRTGGWGSLLCRGWFLGASSLTLMVVIMIPFGARSLYLDFAGPGDLVRELLVYFITGIVVGFIEEIFFRGFVLRSLLGGLRRWPAITVMSLFFAIVHFFRATDMPAPAAFAPCAGFTALAYYFKPLLTPASVIPGFVGLFLVGVVLACAYLWSGSLYLPIGLHAGWVFGIKAEGLFLKQIEAVAPWFFGDGYVVTGVFGWLMLLVMLLIVRRAVPISPYSIGR